MRDTVHLVFTRRGVARLLKSQPSNLGRSEYAVRLVVEVPDSVFAAPPMPTATLSVPAASVIMPTVEVTVAEPQPCPHQWTAPIMKHGAPTIEVCTLCGVERVMKSDTEDVPHE